MMRDIEADRVNYSKDSENSFEKIDKQL